MNHLKKLENEGIHIIREAVASFKNPAMLYSIGKDSSVLLWLALKAFAPGKIPFPLVHIDTGWKFKEMISFRDNFVKEHNLELIVYTNLDGKNQNINPLSNSVDHYTKVMKTDALKQVIDKYKFDAAFGGARRDEEKSRAKERIFSIRSDKHRWDPRAQRPELWNIINPNLLSSQTMRVFPLSNWTEIDIWQYIYQEKIPIVPLYFAKNRQITFWNNQKVLVDDDRIISKANKTKLEMVRFRTLGCYPLSGAIPSRAKSIEEIILELLESKISERAGRLIDQSHSSAMEERKREGYF